MRGFPPIQLLLVVLGFVALGTVLSMMTRPRAITKMEPSTSVPTIEELRARLSIRWAHRPEQLTITHEGHVWADFSAKTLTAPCETTVSFRHQKHSPHNDVPQLECLIKARWPAGTPETALTFTLEPTGHDPLTATLWGEGSLEEIIVLKP